ncbi:carboxypeptidase-like regulatory domain-containing protein [Thermophagus sp. OGC60D27]|uniref:carboxypeptidase-like regulatory domain-containing protein n=1 Tax=Thermophagus sp. OGC60D27 TaxID=3458415 RepID=UPI004037CB81
MYNKVSFFHLFILVSFVLVSCEKDDTSREQFSTISGKLEAGENMITEDFANMQVILAKLGEEVDPEQVTTQTENMELVQTSFVSENGTFVFDSVDAGDYLIALSEGFIMTADTFAVLSVEKGQSVTLEDKIVERQPEENFFGGRRLYTVRFKNKTNGFDENGNYHKERYPLVSIEFYENVFSLGTITPDQVNDGEFKFKLDPDKKTQFVLKCKDINDGTVFTSEKLDFFHSLGANQYDDISDYGYYSIAVKKSWLFGHIIELKIIALSKLEAY